MTTLADFLLARIEGDQIEATMRTLHAEGCGWFPDPAGYTYPCDCGVPERMAREAEAKRRIVEWVRHDSPPEQGAWLADDPNTRYCGGHPASWLPHDDYGPGYCFRVDEDNETLRLLTLPYADHPDFRPEWRVD